MTLSRPLSAHSEVLDQRRRWTPDWYSWLFEVWQNITSMRERLTADRTYYIRTDGNDSNSGLTNTAAGAFQSLDGAYKAVSSSIDFNGHDVTIQVAPGTYGGLNVIRPNTVGTGLLRFLGDSTTPSNVVISVSSGYCFGVGDTNPNNMLIEGFKVTSSSASCFLIQGGSRVAIKAIEFGSCADAHLYIYGTGSAVYLINSTYIISGNAVSHIFADAGGLIESFDTLAYTLTGTPAFSDAFAIASHCGVIEVDLNIVTFTGGASAGTSRYRADRNGVIETIGLPNNWPGGAAGTTATGGQVA